MHQSPSTAHVSLIGTNSPLDVHSYRIIATSLRSVSRKLIRRQSPALADGRKEPAIREAGGRLRGARGTTAPSMRASFDGRSALSGVLATLPAGGWSLRTPLA